MAHPTAHGTLTANQVTTEVFDVASGGPADKVVVAIRGDAAAEIWYTLDGTTPTVEGNGSFFISIELPAAEHVLWQADFEVKLLSTAAADYSILVF